MERPRGSDEPGQRVGPAIAKDARTTAASPNLWRMPNQNRIDYAMPARPAAGKHQIPPEEPLRRLGMPGTVRPVMCPLRNRGWRADKQIGETMTNSDLAAWKRRTRPFRPRTVLATLAATLASAFR